MSSRIKVREKQSSEVLFECEINEENKAYAYAKDMEEIGIEVEVEIPSVSETLISVLGANESDVDALKAMMDEEIDSHNDVSCNDCLPAADKTLH